ncbi:sugar transferase [bacterium]|nr:sugar transferase [bacterium]MBU1025030.1 sugar transferase [bacterium]
MERKESQIMTVNGITDKVSPNYTFYEFSKRTFDIVFSCAFLLISSPVILVTAILMQLESPGPVFYIQKRVGRYGKTFHLVKLRSMPPNAENNGPVLSREDGDGRVGRIGQFIRKSKIDELMQFINVLLGHMSVVGPRPERPFFVKLFSAQFPEFDKRHSVKPGITGLAQFKKLDAFQAFNRLRLDIFYIDHRSFGFDMKIIAHTAAFCIENLFKAGENFNSNNGEFKNRAIKSNNGSLMRKDSKEKATTV